MLQICGLVYMSRNSLILMKYDVLCISVMLNIIFQIGRQLEDQIHVLQIRRPSHKY